MNYVDNEEVSNGYIFASNSEISLLLPDWYEDENEFYEIIKNDTNEVIGTIIFFYENNVATGNVEYFINSQFRGNSYAKKALMLLAENVYKLKRTDLYISILPDNKASIKTALNSGAVFEKKVSIPKHYIFSHDGKYKYANMYILKTRKEDINDKKVNKK